VSAPFIRPYREADRDGLIDVCIRTAAGGGDATGLYSDDLLMPEVFALPYVEYAPELEFVVADPEARAGSRGDRVLGYVLGVADTRAFVEWWRREWGPGFRTRHPSPGPPTGHEPAFTEEQLLAAGSDPGRMLIAEVDDYPAHLHIDLLPELQGQGFGRRLIDTLRGELARRGVPAVHLGMDAANTGARAFYDRLGFHELPSSRPDAPLLGIATDPRQRASDRRSNQ
jgi:ribosomal protein S18 acetylase RimI-like enzyme